MLNPNNYPAWFEFDLDCSRAAYSPYEIEIRRVDDPGKGEGTRALVKSVKIFLNQDSFQHTTG